jgi:hypothetical protein
VRAGINEGRIGDLAAIVYAPWYFQALSPKKHAAQDRLSVPLVMQMRSDLKKLEIDCQPDLTKPHIADLTKPEIDQRARDGRHQGYTKG